MKIGEQEKPLSRLSHILFRKLNCGQNGERKGTIVENDIRPNMPKEEEI